ncbi:juvenile hormone epoxide hydrolase-like isoform X2 [Pectinophora gossypiella]|nr:juvenile hormone epoxide hydrolase-like isoform X2 [Pectinophora gossypiella]
MKNKNQNEKPAKNTQMSQSSSSYSNLMLISSLMAVIVGLASCYIFYYLTTPPEMPNLDPNYWWGSYPMEPAVDQSIRPFEIEFSDVIVNDLRERLLHQRPFTPPLENTGFSYGFNTHFLQQVLDYWKNSYDFKQREAFLNRYNHFKTNIQGLDIHFMRVTPKVEDGITVVPLLLLHGWPSSFREFYELIPRLTAPRPGHNFVFECIVPSLPGFGYSQGPSRPGLGTPEAAVIMHNLMTRLGFKEYYVHGSNVGQRVGAALATMYPRHVLGFHTNTPFITHRAHVLALILAPILPSLVVEPELADRMLPVSDHMDFLIQETGYYHIQATKPDTIGVALTDSPAGLAAYILEKFSTWTNKDYRQASDGNLLAKFTLTHLLDNVMIYWASNSITTSMRIHAESAREKYSMDEIPTEVPTAFIKFRHNLIFQPDWVLRLKFKTLLQSTAVEDGGHFAALEMPDVMADDIFQAVNKFLELHNKDTKPQENVPKVNHETAKTIYEFTVNDINGREVKLDRYKGHVTLIVNVASQCGLTDTNYKQLNELYDKYGKSRGLRILAFPCNQFGGQEPGSPQEIFKFTKDRGVKFDLFEKVEVNGDTAHPLWKFLKRTQGGTIGDFIKWNFSKFIIDKNGVPVERLGPNVNPLDLEPYLAKYW